MSETFSIEIDLHREPGVRFRFLVIAVRTRIMDASLHYDASFTCLDVLPTFREATFPALHWGKTLERETVHKTGWYTPQETSA